MFFGRPRGSIAAPLNRLARTNVLADTPTIAAARRKGTPLAMSSRPRSVWGP